MKKFTKILSLSLVLIMTVLMVASCGIFAPKPAKDPGDAEDALKENDYTVTLAENDIALAAMSAAFNCGDLEAAITAFDKDESITILYFKDKEDANDFYDDMKEEMDEAEKELKEEKDDMDEDDYKELKEELDNYVLGKSGTMVWMASSKDAVKAAK